MFYNTLECVVVLGKGADPFSSSWFSDGTPIRFDFYITLMENCFFIYLVSGSNLLANRMCAMSMGDLFDKDIYHEQYRCI